MKHEEIRLNHYRYAPWQEDLEFAKLYQNIKASTLVDVYRSYELWSLVEQTAKLKEGAFIEIGVWRGGTGALIAKKAKLCGLNDTVYLCDTFTGVVKATSKDDHYKGGEHADVNYDDVINMFKGLGLDNVKFLKGIYPDDTKSLMTDNKIRFCHIDVDTYQSTKDIVDSIWDMIVPNGIIVFDDYGFHGCGGATVYGNEIQNDKDKIFLYNLNGHSIVIKR